MILDSHTHAWDRWPYDPPVPDPESRGRVEQLLWEMDRNGVDQAIVVCARIDHNPDDNDYIAECVHESGQLVAMDLVEVNPSLEKKGAEETVRAGCSLVRCALGDTLL